MLIENGQIFAVRLIREDGSSEMRYYKFSDMVVDHIPVAEQFLIEE